MTEAQEMAELEQLELAELEAESAQGQPPRGETPKEEEAWYEDLAEGLAYSGMDTYYGLKGLGTELTPEEHARLNDWKTDSEESGWGTAGRVLGEVGQIALTGGLGGAALKGAGLAGKMGRALPVATDVGASMLHGAATAPEMGETRLGEAGEAGAYALGGFGLSKAIQKLGKGINISDDAKELLDKGVELTPAQASGGALPNYAEIAMQVTPLAAGREASRSKAAHQWTRKVFDEAKPTGAKLKKTGQEGNKELADSYTKAYSKAWDAAESPADDAIIGLVNAAQKGSSRLSDDAKRVVDANMNDIIDLQGSFSTAKLKGLDKTLRNDISTAVRKEDFDLKPVLEEMRATLRDSAGSKAAKKLKKIDTKFPNFLAVQKAATDKAGMADGGFFTPESLLAASKSVGGTSRAFKGTSPLLKTARQGQATVGKKSPQFLADVRKAGLKVAPVAPFMDDMGRALMGRTKPQENAMKLIEELRNTTGLSGAKLGGAYQD